MAAIQFDTSFLIRALIRGTPEDQMLRVWLADGRPLSMSTIAWSEFLCGPVTPETIDLVARLVGSLVSFGQTEAELSADLFNQTGGRRNSVVDCMIAATALANGADLATSNVKDFRRFEAAGLGLAEG